MSRRFRNDTREPDLMTWSDVPRIYWFAMGIAILLGMVSGVIWIGWKLIQFHVLSRIAP
jgi:hypothetical protein